MRLTKAHQDLIAARQARVAELRLERLTHREIAERLAAEGSLNPDTGEPWTHVTIGADCRALTRVWQSEALGDTKPLKAELWAEIRRARKIAWEQRDLLAIGRLLKQEAELLGLDAPLKVDLAAYVRELAAREGLDPEEAVATAERILKENRA